MANRAVDGQPTVSKLSASEIVPTDGSGEAARPGRTDQDTTEELRRWAEYYQKVTRNFPNGTVTIYDRNLRLKFVAGQELESSGRNAGDLVGKTFEELAPHEVFVVAEPHLRGAFEGRTGMYEAPYWGEKFYHVNVAPLTGLDGTIDEILVIAQDITERKRTEEALRKSEEGYRALAEAAQESIFVISRDGTVEYVNKFAASQFKCRPEEILGKEMTSLFPPEISQRQHGSLQRVFETSQASYAEGQAIFPGGAVWLGTWLSPLFDEGGQVRAVLGVSRDITERKRTEEALREREFWLKESQRIARVGSYVLDIQRGEWKSSDVLDDIFGLEQGAEKTVSSWVALVHPDEQKKLQEYFANFVIAQRRPFNKEYRIVRPCDGEVRWLWGLGELVLGEDGSPIRMIGTIQDITERKQAADALRDSESRFKSLFEFAPDTYFLMDVRGTFIDGNKAAEELTGYKREELIGKNLLTSGLFSKAEAGNAADSFAQALRGVSAVPQEFTLDRKGGGQAIVEVRSQAMRIGGQDVILGIARDITERKKLESQFLRAQRLESLGTLASGIAHDLNNILAPILLSFQVLHDTVKDERGRKMLAVAESSAMRGKNIVTQVLGVARGSAGERGAIQVRHLVKEISEIMRETFPKSIEIDQYVAKDLWGVSGDATQLHQLLMNLVVNARDAMPEGGILRITGKNFFVDEHFSRFRPGMKPGPYIILSIKDTGAGMTPEVLDRIFDPFFTTKQQGKGTGLGLSTVHSIAKSHGGFVEVSSEPGKGSAFDIYLPASSHAEITFSTKSSAKLPRGSGETILFVDDEEAIREITRGVLESYGYTVLTAADGMHAFELFSDRSNHFDLVITDLMMPIMDGLALIQTIRATGSPVRIIASSGLPSNETTAQLEKLGVRDFLHKPYASDALLRLVGFLLGKEGKQ